MSPPHLVLLHPYPTDARFWDALRMHLDPAITVIAPDASGFGGRVRHPGWTIAGEADTLAADIATRCPGGAAAIMGLSMGGYIALALAARHPARCTHLVLADTRADADDAATRAGRQDAIASIRAGRRADYLSGLLPRLIAPAAPAGVRTALTGLTAQQTDDALVDALAALAGRPDRRPDLAGMTMPALVLVGSEDRITPPAAARELADGLPGATLVEIPGVGHLSALERPEAVADAVERFLATGDPVTR